MKDSTYKSIIFTLLIIVFSNLSFAGDCTTCRYELGLHYDSSNNRLDGELSTDRNQFSQYFYFRNSKRPFFQISELNDYQPSWLYEIDIQFNDENRTIGVESDDADQQRFGAGLFFVLKDNDDVNDGYDPDNLPSLSAGATVSFVNSDLFDDDFNIDMTLQSRKTYSKKIIDDGAEIILPPYKDWITRGGLLIEHERDFSSGSTIYFDSQIRFGDVTNLTQMIGPRFVVNHFFSDSDELEDETTVSIQLVSEFEFNQITKVFDNWNPDYEIRLRPTVGYDKVFNSLGNDVDLSSIYFMIDFSIGYLDSGDSGSGRSGGGRYRRP